jgi:hypothetical protein
MTSFAPPPPPPPPHNLGSQTIEFFTPVKAKLKKNLFEIMYNVYGDRDAPPTEKELIDMVKKGEVADLNTPEVVVSYFDQRIEPDEKLTLSPGDWARRMNLPRLAEAIDQRVDIERATELNERAPIPENEQAPGPFNVLDWFQGLANPIPTTLSRFFEWLGKPSEKK